MSSFLLINMDIYWEKIVTSEKKEADLVTVADGRVRVTSMTLSDGRELIYFDDSADYVSGKKTRTLTDSRDLPQQQPLSSMRRDPLTGEWSTYAAHRMNRTFMPPANENPLGPTQPHQLPTEIPSDDYDVVVFENRFPSFARAAYEGEALPETVDGMDLVQQRKARGRCEVVCFSPNSSGSFCELSPTRVRTIIEAWAHRTKELSQLEGIKEVFCFENRGEEIGVTLQHPHGQIYAYPFLPPRIANIVEQAKDYAQRTGRRLFDDVIDQEQRAGTRIVAKGKHWLAYVPAAAKWPLELMLVPLRHVADFTELTDEEKEELATLYPRLLRQVDRFFPGVEKTAYIAAWNQAPVGEEREYGRLHLQLFSLRRSPDKMKFLAGSESAMAVWINDTTPEKIAERLREVEEEA